MDPGSLALALLAGAVAAFNPCGFALLPPYLALLVARREADDGWSALVRAVRFTTGMTVGFVAVFAGFGLVVAPLALSVERYLPVVTVVVGVGLVLLGGLLVTGRSLPGPRRLRLGGAPTRSWLSQVWYGVAFALASLSCTIGPFLAVTSTTLRGTGVLEVVASYVAYALGMGVVVLVLAVAVATARASVIGRMRAVGAVVGRLGGVVLVLAGAYVAWYGWFEIRVQAGRTTSDPVVSAALRVQSALTRFVSDLGAGTVVVVGAVLALLVAAAWLRRRRGSVAGSEHRVGP